MMNEKEMYLKIMKELPARQKVPVRIKRLTTTAVTPEYAKPGDSGFDLSADIQTEMPVYVGECVMVPTGLAMEIPDGWELQIRTRSGVHKGKVLPVTNSPGTIDSGYRGEICVLLSNPREELFYVRPGDRIAQGVLCPVGEAVWEEVPADEQLSETARGAGGFGHTGVAANAKV